MTHILRRPHSSNDQSVKTTSDKNLELSQAQMWRSIVIRDHQVDEQFVYGVLSTGIFCRPSCPSRQPKRENVRFFVDVEQAQASGLRPCKRCKPLGDSAHQMQLKIIKQACKQLSKGGESASQASLANLAAQANLSPGYFQRTFKQVVGITPKQYEVACRSQRLRELLKADTRVTDAIYNAGYDSPAPAYANAANALGMTPSNYKTGAAKLIISYAVVSHARLGWLIVAVTGKGVCAIEFGESKDQLHDVLEQRFNQAQLVEDNNVLQPIMQTIVSHIEQPQQRLDLPLDIHGTAFQHRVWRALSDIPAGAQRSYSEVAQAIGQPRAVRAVATACAKNPVALAVPCHRVVRADGSLGGYRWGTDRKKQLLEWEART